MSDILTFASADAVAAQRDTMEAYFRTGRTYPAAARRLALGRLKSALQANEKEILDALHTDLGKSAYEGFTCELGLIYAEISYVSRHLGSWMRPRCVATPLAVFPGRSKTYPMPRGVVLIESPWNYPLLLSIEPLVDAIAAGCCAALKFSHTSKATSDVLTRIVNETFDPAFVCALDGPEAINDWVLDVPWDMIFFTGSPAVGRTVMAAAAKNLTPVLLELGGKSPCVVAADADIEAAASRIAWGKGLNSGQTCVAPDYLLVHESVADELVAKIEEWFHRYYGADILASPAWPHMISAKQYERVCGLIDTRTEGCFVAFGGGRNAEALQIEPTVMRGVTYEDAVMQEEIFGPVLPVITYEDEDEVFANIRKLPKPLGAYLFTNGRALQQRFIRELDYGGCCINDVVVQLVNDHMGFGGVGNSGMGQYHGKAGFDCFTHVRPVLNTPTFWPITLRTTLADEPMRKFAHLILR